jgi:hypothetical protein
MKPDCKLRTRERAWLALTVFLIALGTAILILEWCHIHAAGHHGSSSSVPGYPSNASRISASDSAEARERFGKDGSFPTLV